MNQFLKTLFRSGCLLPILFVALPVALSYFLCGGGASPTRECVPGQSTPWWCILLAMGASYLGMILYGWLDSLRIRKAQRSIARQRLERGYDLEEHYFSPMLTAGIPREICEAVLEKVRQWGPSEDFPVEAADELMGETLNIQGEDLWDLMEELLAAFKKRPFEEEEEHGITCRTVQDLAEFIHKQPYDDIMQTKFF